MTEKEKQYRAWALKAPLAATLGAAWDAAWDHQQQRIDELERELAEEKQQHVWTKMGASAEAHEADRLREEISRLKATQEQD